MKLKDLKLIPFLGILALTACQSNKEEYAGGVTPKVVLSKSEETDEDPKPESPLVLETLTTDSIKGLSPLQLRQFYILAMNQHKKFHQILLKEMLNFHYYDGKIFEGLNKHDDKELAQKKMAEAQASKMVYQNILDLLTPSMSKESLDTLKEKTFALSVPLSPFDIESLAFKIDNESNYELGQLAVHIKEELACQNDELPYTMRMVTNAKLKPGTIYPGSVLKLPPEKPDRGLYIPTAKGNLFYFRGFVSKNPSELNYIVCPEKLKNGYVGSQMIVNFVSSDGLGYPIPGSVIIKGFQSVVPNTVVKIIEDEVVTP